jgi:hypothetical protein
MDGTKCNAVDARPGASWKDFTELRDMHRLDKTFVIGRFRDVGGMIYTGRISKANWSKIPHGVWCGSNST